MQAIIDWASFYTEKGLWVYPSDLEEKQWVYWKGIKTDKDYKQVCSKWSWNSTASIKLVVGKKGVRVLEVTNKRLLKKALVLLGLPEEYHWLIYSQSKYGIIIDTPSVSILTKGMKNRPFKQVRLLWEGYYSLPSVGVPIYFYKNRKPTGHPTQIPDELFLNCLENLI